MCIFALFWPTTVALLCQAPVLSYAEAYELAVTKDRPLVVLVGASWCPGCKMMERELIPRLSGQRFRDRIAFAKVDLDKELRLGRQLVGDGPIPQLFVFRRLGDRWRAVRLIGVQDFMIVERHIRQLTEAAAEEVPTLKSLFAFVPPEPPGKRIGRERPAPETSPETTLAGNPTAAQ